MRTLVKYTLFLMVVTLSFGCQKDDSAVLARIINVELKNTETYKVDLGGFGDEEGASVITQAVNFEISNTERTPNGGVAYYYKPKASFTGTDFTVVGIYRGSDGATPSRLVEKVKFKFTITD
jgi:hypothetical protein